MRKTKIIIVILLAFISITSFVLLNLSGEQQIKNVLNLNEIDKIQLRDGTNGKCAFIYDKEKLERITEYCGLINVKRKYFVQNSSGWEYNISFYSKDKNVGSITFNNPLYIDTKRYYMTNKDFSEVYISIQKIFMDKSISWK